MSYIHTYFGKTTENSLLINFDHFLRGLFAKDFDETSTKHVTDRGLISQLEQLNSRHNSGALTFQRVKELSEAKTISLATSQYLGFGFR